MNINEWMESGKYLPELLRDFHDQKDTFKAIHEITSDNQSTKDISWIQSHCYVIDVFLWFMAMRGYTMQRSRAKLEFRDLASDIKAQKKKRDAMFFSAPKQGIEK